MVKAKDAEIVTLKAQLKDAQDPAIINANIVDRLSVISKAKVLMGDKWTAGASTTEQMRREVVSSKVGDKAKAWDDKEIAACFEGLHMPTFSQNKDNGRAPIDDAIAAFGRPGQGFTTLQEGQDADMFCRELRSPVLRQRLL